MVINLDTPTHKMVKMVRVKVRVYMYLNQQYDDDDVYLDKLQTKGVKKSILYM
jgi:hypothetical protein